LFVFCREGAKLVKSTKKSKDFTEILHFPFAFARFFLPLQKEIGSKQKRTQIITK
jgi:hypothetical protein